MEKNYDHSASEDQIYARWEASGRMRADAHSDKSAYTIVLPPPNVTGQLHLGHAAMLAIEDILIRYKKMRGYEALWVPGTDHAAIATESVVIKHLGIKSREALSREDFLTECRKFATEKHDTIVNQTKKMGAWLDWSREAYTFDEARNYSVNKIFKDLYEDGLIERGYRLINWSHGAQSVLSDDELEWEDREESFYYIQVGEFIMGTVRPETKCADSPLFVNPEGIYVRVKYTKDSGEAETYIVAKNLYDDEKRWQLIFGEREKKGRFDLVEEIQGKDLVGVAFEYETYAGMRQFWVMADADVIDMNKGTGSMTISAAHSADDYDLAKRHGLDDMFFSKIDFEGKMTDVAGPCAGMTIEEARKEAVKIMRKKGLIIGEEKNYIHRVPICYRSSCVVEPMISAQWFIAVEKEFTDKWTGQKTTLKKQMQEAVRNGHVKIIPDRFNKTYFHWIDNLRDWCISRQIWWGHRIPVWYDEDEKIHLGREQTVYFVRHGESEWNAKKIMQGASLKKNPLTDNGQEQAKETAQKLKGLNLEKIVASDLERAQETAKIIKDELGLDLEIELWEDLREVSFGHEVEGNSIENALGQSHFDYLKTVEHLQNEEWKKAETFKEIQQRAEKVFEKLKTLDAEKVLVVTHGFFLGSLFKIYQSGNLDHCEKFFDRWNPKNGEHFDMNFFIAPKQEKKVSTFFMRTGQSDFDEEFSPNSEESMEEFWTECYGEREPQLSKKGKNEIRESIQNLKKEFFQKIIFPDSKIGKETAKILSEELNLPIEKWKEIQESDLHSYYWSTFSKNHERYCEVKANQKFIFKTYIKDYYKNAKIVLNKIEKENKNLLIVSQGFFIAIISALQKNIPPENFLDYFENEWNLKNGEIKEYTSFLLQNHKKGTALRQDEDTLDTWFSSALWPFSTIGWPDEKHPDFQKFYPNDVLETGHDILFFWVARMIMFGRYATGKYPFHTSYLHGLVCDEQGKKMSKSKGNGIDPLDVIKEFGADPVRCALVIGSTPGNPIPIGKSKISGYRNFVNKIWNAGRFVKMQLDNTGIQFNDGLEPRAQNVSDQWIAARFSRVSKKVAEHLDKYEISQAGDMIYHFVWDEFCDWYLEAQKAAPNPEFLAWMYFEILKLTHPLCPFVTDKIYQEFWGEAESIMDHQWPKFDFENKEAEEFFGLLQTVVTEIRKVRADKGLNPKEKVEVKISMPHGVDKSIIAALQGNGQVIKILSNASAVDIDQNISKPENSVTVFAGALEIFVSVPFDAETEKKRLEKEIGECEKKITALEGRLANKSYTENAPAHLVEQTRNELGAAKEEKRKLEGEREKL